MSRISRRRGFRCSGGVPRFVARITALHPVVRGPVPRIRPICRASLPELVGRRCKVTPVKEIRAQASPNYSLYSQQHGGARFRPVG